MSHAVLRGDHHVHSTFSDDAVSTLEENVAAGQIELSDDEFETLSKAGATQS